MNNNFSKEIEVKARELNFDIVGFSSSEFLDKSIKKKLQRFVSEGRHGNMEWLENSIDRRSSPKKLWRSAKTAIIFASNYGPKNSPLDSLCKTHIGNISVYARNKDYHKWMKGRLKNFSSWFVSKTQASVKVFVDTAPIMEKPLAEQAGIGWIGKHTNLINDNYGNWLFLGVVLTDLIIDFIEKYKNTNLCGSCSKCIDICPTNAFIGPYKLDARRCISYLTIEYKGNIPREYRSLIGNRIYGCDDCLAICPWNKFAKITKNINFKERKELINPSLKELVKLTDAEFRIFFSGSPIKRIGRDRFIRNVLIAIGNSKLKSLLPSIINLLDDNSILVQLASIWALSQISKNSFFIEKNKRINFLKNKELISEWKQSEMDII